MSWTQSCCDLCWPLIRPDRDPIRTKDRDVECCSFCGLLNDSGIYVRADPRTVPYPRTEPEEDS